LVATYSTIGLRLGNITSWRVNSFIIKNESLYLHIFNKLSFFPRSVLRFGKPTSKRNRIFYSRRAWNRYVYRRMKNFRERRLRCFILCYPQRSLRFPSRLTLSYNFKNFAKISKYPNPRKFFSYPFERFLAFFRSFKFFPRVYDQKKKITVKKKN